MYLKLGRIWPLAFIALCILFTAVSSQEQAQTPLANSRNRDGDNRQYAPGVQATSWGRSSHDPVELGASSVYQAMSILQKIKPSSNRLSRYNKPSGVLGTTAYYAKELFFILFMNKPPQHELITSNPKPKVLGQPLAEAVKLLEDAAVEMNPDAIFLLAEMNFYGNFTHPRNYSEAFRRYQELATLNGNTTAQHMIGFMYATGIGGAVKMDQARALLYHTFAAEAGHIRSEMTVAYRHHAGISTPRNCEEAVYHYRNVANKAIDWFRSGPPGGQDMFKDSYRIADDEGGVFGEGASVSSSGPNAKQGGPNPDTHAAFDDVMEYLDLMSRKGDLKATYNMGRLYYDGSRVLKRNLRAAYQHFREVARAYWDKNGKTKPDIPHSIEKLASKAAGYIGRMFLRGEIPIEDKEDRYKRAQIWFKRGISNGDSLSHYSLGLMYLFGLGTAKDPVKAADCFSAAADQDHASAQVRLGALFLDQGDVTTATQYFNLASRNNHLEAFYYLAELSYQGIERDKSCGMAAVYYKIVAEKAEAMLASFKEANVAYEAGDLETALVDYMMAAEQGFEAGQANVAYLLDQARPRLTFGSLLPFTQRKASLLGDASLALIYWTRSAKQLNVDSIVKMGDYYLDGVGTPLDPEKAAACYSAASETLTSALALWNLGWLHENGIGVEQDFHLAKRFYDQALEINREAYLPVTLSLFKLRVRSWWNTVTHGRVRSIGGGPAPKKKRTLREWISQFLENEAAYYEQLADDYEPREGMPGGDYDYDDLDDGILESVIIVTLSLALIFLIYYRNARQVQHQRAQAEQRRQQQQQHQNDNANAQQDVRADNQAQQDQQQREDPGLFPQPGDPAFNNWVVGGVGH